MSARLRTVTSKGFQMNVIDGLEREVAEGWVRRVVSPCGKLVLYNYTKRTQYEHHWNEHTIMARGLVYEISTGRRVALPFPKFFNLFELDDDTQQRLLGETDFTVTRKEDGVLGIIYHYDGAWRVNTRGSFTSYQSGYAREMLPGYDLSRVDQDLTLLVEIIHPEARIVVPYGDTKKLVLIGAYNRVTGEEVLLDEIDTDLEKVREYNFSSIQDVIERQGNLAWDEEGFVVRFSDGYRIKLKSLAYLGVARARQGMNLLSFWKQMRGCKVPEEVMMAIPEEYAAEARALRDELEGRALAVRREAEAQYEHILSQLDTTDGKDLRRQMGVYLQNHADQGIYKSLMFPIMDGKEKFIEKRIMAIIKPKLEG